jgi:hypothetical protein
MDFFYKLQKILPTLECELSTTAQGNARTPDIFVQSSKAALIRSYEFLCHVPNIGDETAFFMMPFLRGVCEDYIVLRFLHSKLGNDVDDVIRIKLTEDICKSSISQWNFFKANRPNQKLYYKQDFQSEEREISEKLKTLLSANNVHVQKSRNPLPTVRKMAEESNLLELYDYVYHATSSLVHFNPRILLRMGWGDLPNVTFSVKNFGKYYKYFTCFYATYMFLQLCQWSVSLGIVETTIVSKLDALAKLIQDEPRWPELVTAEELGSGSFLLPLVYKSPSEVKMEAEGEVYPDVDQSSS